MPVSLYIGNPDPNRKRLLDAELERFVEELPPLGVHRAYLTGDVAIGKIEPDTELELVLVQDTVEPFHRRADFFVTHLRPSVGTRFLVYSPEEFADLESIDPVLVKTKMHGEAIFEE